MVEVVVCQQNTTNHAAGGRHRILGDRSRLGQRGAGVDEQNLAATLNQADGDVAERQRNTWRVSRSHARFSAASAIPEKLPVR